MKKLFFVVTFFFISSHCFTDASNFDMHIFNCATIRPRYNIYEINNTFYAFPNYGIELKIRRRFIKSGKEYFPVSIPYWLRINFSNRKNIPTGILIKPFYGDCQQIDTFIFRNIILKKPIIIDNDSSIKPIKNNNNEPIIITDFKYSNGCKIFPFNHFDVITLSK